MKFCIGCEKRGGNEFFFREKDSRCKECTNKYQRDRRKKQKEEKNSEDTFNRLLIEDAFSTLLDKLFEEKYSAFNADIIEKLDEINDKLNSLIISKNKALEGDIYSENFKG